MKRKAVAVLVNDIHLDKGNGELIKDIFLNQLINLCLNKKIDNIFIGGDVFTNRSGQPLTCLTVWKEILEGVKEKGIRIHVIPGNHDKTYADDERSYLDIYSGQFIYRNAACRNFDGLDVIFIPYFKDEKWLEEFQRVDCKRDKDNPAVLITHTGFDGVRNNDGGLVQSSIKPSMFKDYAKVLIGHYHDASKLSSNVFYTGSAYQNNYGESVTDKGFTVIYNDGATEFVPSHFPRYIKEIIQADDKETLMNLLEKYDGETYDHIRFVFVGKKTDCQKINIAEIQGQYGLDCKFQSNEEKEAIEISESDSVLCYDKKAIVKDFFKFCSENEIKGEKMKYGLNLIKNIDYVESN